MDCGGKGFPKKDANLWKKERGLVICPTLQWFASDEK
jgi:hypothetical protein